MLDYLVPKQMLSRISYTEDADENGGLGIKPKYNNFNLEIVDGHLVFTYDAELDIAIADKSVLSFIFEDDEGFFSFIVAGLTTGKSDIYHQDNFYLLR